MITINKRIIVLLIFINYRCRSQVAIKQLKTRKSFLNPAFLQYTAIILNKRLTKEESNKGLIIKNIEKNSSEPKSVNWQVTLPTIVTQALHCPLLPTTWKRFSAGYICTHIYVCIVREGGEQYWPSHFAGYGTLHMSSTLYDPAVEPVATFVREFLATLMPRDFKHRWVNFKTHLLSILLSSFYNSILHLTLYFFFFFRHRVLLKHISVSWFDDIFLYLIFSLRKKTWLEIL